MNLYEQLSKERKKAQWDGETPEWMTTGGYQMYKEKLAYKDETFELSIGRVAQEAASWGVHLDLAGRSKKELTQRFFHLMWNNWLVPSTPVLANMGTERGLPVSCSGSFIEDSIDSFYTSFHEAAMLTKTGHGCSCYLGNIRPRGTSYGDGEGKADGVLPVIKQMLQTVSSVSQGSTRRGATAFYIELTHGDVEEVMDYHLANPKRLQIGYIITDEFVNALQGGRQEAQVLWKRLMKVRCQTGKAYIVFTDKANRHAKDLGIRFNTNIVASNLCTEIFLPSNKEETFSCVLSSINAYTYDEWKKDEMFVHDCILFLNCVVDSYLENMERYAGMDKIKTFTERYRALGLGVLGFTSYLQKQSIALESLAASQFNTVFFKNVFSQAKAAGDYYYNATVMAVAPNVTSALVGGGVSQGIEPFTSNVFTQETAAGDIYRMNPELLKLMREKGIHSESNIQEIKKNNGSIQGNPLFTEHEQQVFKTAYEIDQSWLVKLAGDRGKYIDQGQSLNLFFADDAPEQYISRVHKEAVLSPYVKSLYYLNTKVGVQGSTGECMMCAS